MVRTVIATIRNPISHSRRQRGIALVYVLMLLVVFLMLVFALIDVLRLALRDSAASAESNSALTAAYSGVNGMILAIEEYYQSGTQSGPMPTSTTYPFPDPAGGRSTTSYSAKVIKTYNAHGLNYYLIQSDGQQLSAFANAAPGSSQGIMDRQVTALVRQVPFGAFAMWTGSEATANGGTVWYTSKQSYGGPVYSGGEMHILYTPVAPGATPNPIFGDGFITAATPHWRNVDDPSDRNPPAPGSQADSVFGPGTSGAVTGVAQSLPGLNQNLIVASEALYGDDQHVGFSDLPPVTKANAGVYLNDPTLASGSGCNSNSLTTGIFVQGDAQLTATGNAAGNTETFQFDPVPGGQKSDPSSIPSTVIVTINLPPPGLNTAGSTSVLENGTTTTCMGVPSGVPLPGGSQGKGVIFDNGTLEITDGSTIHGQYTIAAPDPPPTRGADDIYLDGKLTYTTAYNSVNPASTDELALWANDIFLKSNDSKVEIDGMILTGYLNECLSRQDGCRPDGFFGNLYCTRSGCGGGKGNLTMVGALIQNIRGEVGAIAPGPVLLGGYMRTDVYDARLAQNPTPFSPTTNEYDIIAIVDDGAVDLNPSQQ